MLTNFKDFFKNYYNNILLVLIVILLSLLAFGAGMLTQFALEKPPLQIEYPSSNDVQE